MTREKIIAEGRRYVAAAQRVKILTRASPYLAAARPVGYLIVAAFANRAVKSA
jgi:hypothetical protein